jgi:hypothetical protein
MKEKVPGRVIKVGKMWEIVRRACKEMYGIRTGSLEKGDNWLSKTK